MSDTRCCHFLCSVLSHPNKIDLLTCSVSLPHEHASAQCPDDDSFKNLNRFWGQNYRIRCFLPQFESHSPLSVSTYSSLRSKVPPQQGSKIWWVQQFQFFHPYILTLRFRNFSVLDSFGFGIETNWFQKNVSDSVSKKFGIQKSIGFGIGQKFVLEKSFGFIHILGIVTHWVHLTDWFEIGGQDRVIRQLPRLSFCKHYALDWWEIYKNIAVEKPEIDISVIICKYLWHLPLFSKNYFKLNTFH